MAETSIDLSQLKNVDHQTGLIPSASLPAPEAFYSALTENQFHPDHFQILASKINRVSVQASLFRFPGGLYQKLAFIQKERFESAVATGLGFRILNGQLYFPELFRLCSFTRLKMKTQPLMNVYYSSMTESSLPSHSDNTDVYVVQLFGKKLWTIGSETFELKPGDTLFIPRGVVHQVMQTEYPSCHLSYFFPSPTLRDHLLEQWNHPLLDTPANDVTLESWLALLKGINDRF